MNLLSKYSMTGLASHCKSGAGGRDLNPQTINLGKNETLTLS